MNSMSDETPVSLELILRHIKLQTEEIRSLRDDVNVLTAIAMRQDGTLTNMLTELRATHSQFARMANRVREIEARFPV